MRDLLTLLFLLSIAGCTASGQHFKVNNWVYEPVEADQELGLELTRLSPSVIESLARPPVPASANAELESELKNYEYLIGPNDILIFTVWDHPELTIPAGEFRSPEIQGHLVALSGEIFFPYVGSVRVAGKTLVEVRRDLTKRLARYIQNPQLDVRIAGFRSKRINVSGQVMNPGSFPITDTPMTLLDALNLAGGATPEAAVQEVQVLRAGRTLTTNLLRLWFDGDMSQNLLLRDGDVVFVPHNSFYVAHVMGSVVEPGAISMTEGRLNLAEALTKSGGFDRGQADTSRVFVFRYRADGPQVYWLDAASPDAMLLATQFPLHPQDVVFVASSTLARWNRLVSLVLPTIQSLWQTQSFIDDLNN